MSFEIVRNDITNMRVDAIVNTANPRPVIGSGVDALIHAKAGPRLLQARQRIGRIGAGHAAITPGYDLVAEFVIHTVGPVWRGGFFGEEKLLRSCYDSALKLALEQGCGSVAFPLISTGNYGFPKDKALQIAISAFSSFLMEHEMRIYLVVFDRTSFILSEKLFRDVASYIDENYVAEQDRFGTEPLSARNRREMDFAESCVLREEPVFCAMAAPDWMPLSSTNFLISAVRLMTSLALVWRSKDFSISINSSYQSIWTSWLWRTQAAPLAMTQGPSQPRPARSPSMFIM